MSSIYRKGRDGYYYYQAYIYNPKSKKKNKRVFHSLGTKERAQAVKQQFLLDEKYNNSQDKNLKKLHKTLFYGIPFSLLIVGIVFSINFFFNKSTNIENKTSAVTKAKIIKNSSPNNYINPIYNISKRRLEEKQKILLPPHGNLEESNDFTQIDTPKYKVERVNKISDIFDQGEIHVTIENGTSKESQLFLCKVLTEKYSEFSNIIICLYSSSQAGTDLAVGKINDFNPENQKKSWLALYTFNSVEGEYFDNNPSGYLGFN